MSGADFSKLRKFLAPEFVFGQNASLLAGRYAANLGCKKLLLVSDPGVSAAGWTALVERSLGEYGLKSQIFLEVSENPRDHQVMAGAELYLAKGCDMLLAVGGGSPMDCAKGIGIVVGNGGNILDFEGADNVPLPGPPLICVPTTAGSSADVSQFAIINDTVRKVKIAIVSKVLVPDVALIDPLLSTTMSPELTANTGLDALTHAVEAYVSNASSPMTDILALEAVRLVAAHLPQAVNEPQNMAAREAMMRASLYAGLAFSNAILGAVHAMAHSLGGFLDLPHGLCNAILLEAVMRRNFQACPQKYCEIGRALGAGLEGLTGAAAEQAVFAALGELKRAVGVNANLGELGVTLEDIPKLAILAAADPCLLTNPAELSLKDLEEIYEHAL